MSQWKGSVLTLSIEGKSHDPLMKGELVGMPSGIVVDKDALRAFMERRAPGKNPWSTPRKESDEVDFLCGVSDGLTTGEPLVIKIANTNMRSGDYDRPNVPRPGHADFAYYMQAGHMIEPGGGAFSGRLTAPICALGFVALEALKARGILVAAKMVQIHDIECDTAEVTPELETKMLQAKVDQDSVGGKVKLSVTGLPAGVGGPYFNGLDTALGGALFGIPAVKAVEFGIGTHAAELYGSQNNDPFGFDTEGNVVTLSNNHGGLLGGITSGMPLDATITFKPTPSISKKQQSVNLDTGQIETLSVHGRHDPCIVPRALPVVEAVAALVVFDALLAHEHAQAASAAPETLAQAREQLDVIDDQLVALFNERMDVVEEVARIKRQQGGAINDPAREEAILERLTAQCSPERKVALRRLYTTLFEVSKERQSAE